MMLAVGLSGISPFFLILIAVLLASAFLMKRNVDKIRKDLDIVEYKLSRGEIEQAPEKPSPEERLPGYEWLTFDDYKEIYEEQKVSLMREIGRY